MRAPNGNQSYIAGAGSDTLDFSYLNDVIGAYGAGYGIDYTNRGGSDRVKGTVWDDSFTLSSGAEIIDGAGGSDTVNYSRSTAGVSVNLNVVIQAGGFAQGDRLTNIENVTGSEHKDTLIGNAAANVLVGLDGNDTLAGNGGHDRLDGGLGDDILDGGDGNDTLLGGLGNDTLIAGAGNNVLDGSKGIDTVDYSAHGSGLWIGLGGSDPSDGGVLAYNGDMYAILSNPDATPKDTLSWIENVNGTAYADVILGSDAANTLLGNGGADIILGAGGSDTEMGGAGNDTLGTMVIGFGGFVGTIDDTGNDKLYGGLGDDILVGSSGADRMDGGDDIDTVNYAFSPEAVVVDLTYGNGRGSATSWSNGDTFFSIETVIGSGYADTLIGSAGDETIDGGGLDDDIYGFAGNDVLFGGTGWDTIQGGDGDDDMTGGQGNDTFLFVTEPYPYFFSGEPGEGDDVIHDFEVQTDRIAIVGSSLEDLTFTQNGANTVIGYDDGSTITLENVAVDDLMANLSSAIVFV
jgi:Ca2+-binding RTX toxin-like protein